MCRQGLRYSRGAFNFSIDCPALSYRGILRALTEAGRACHSEIREWNTGSANAPGNLIQPAIENLVFQMIKLLDLAGSTHHNILLLQGPVGPFFRYFASDLQQEGCKVFKVNFNGGDWLFYPTKAVNYNSSFSEWPDFLERFIK